MTTRTRMLQTAEVKMMMRSRMREARCMLFLCSLMCKAQGRMNASREQPTAPGGGRGGM